MKTEVALRSIKFVHSAVWLGFVLCIGAIPILGYRGSFRLAAWLVGLVLIEVLVLVINGMRCPLTGIAARYTEDRRDNFGIYLSAWLARHNKSIFGLPFIRGSLFTLASVSRERTGNSRALAGAGGDAGGMLAAAGPYF